jgi:hypothetical protein
MVLRNALARAAAPLRGAAQAQLSSAGVIGTLAPLARLGAPRHYRNPVENELYDRSRQEYSLGNRVPSVAADAWIAPNATLIGDTDVADQCSVWHGAVLKGDLGPVRLGAFSNVQERCVIDAAGCVEQIPRFSKTPTVSARARVPRKGSDGRREATRAPTRGDPRGSRRVDPKSTKSVDGSGRVRCRLQRLFAKKRVFFHTESPPEPLFPNRVQTKGPPTLTHLSALPDLSAAPRRASVST